MARNGVIGRDNRLPWRLPADLAFFKPYPGSAGGVLQAGPTSTLSLPLRPLG